ncbi:hypothetical protein ACFV3R_25385 [Streptomyces sp. NPDC059740]|uniref:hypothetical protein n=1 Tax=Streptomyces sp. NPDC059740 TaxID=3346926 RepID=UPI00365600FD
MSSTWDTLAKRLDQLKPAVATFTICDDEALRQELAAAKTDAAGADETLANLGPDDEPHRPMFEQRAQQARARLTDVQKRFDKTAIVLRFRALARADLEQLQRAHPATEQEEADGADFAMDSFAPALISAASVDGMPADYARQALDTWPAADARALWQAAWSIQHTGRTDLGKG